MIFSLVLVLSNPIIPCYPTICPPTIVNFIQIGDFICDATCMTHSCNFDGAILL